MAKSKDRRVTTKMKFVETSIVDLGAQDGAEIVFMKRRDGTRVDDAAATMKRAAITSEMDGHSHLLNLECYNGIATSGTTSVDGGSSYGYPNNGSHQHQWVMNDDGEITLAMTNGHTHKVKQFSALAYVAKLKPKDDEDEDAYTSRFMGDEKTSSEFPDKKQRAAVAHQMFKDKKKSKATKSIPAGDPAADEGEAAMADESKLAETQKALEAANARALRAEALAEMPADQQAFAKSLAEGPRQAFIAAPEADRAARVAKSLEADAIVYTATDGRAFRKSHDPAMVALVKSNDTLVAKAAAAEERELVATFKSRVPAELGNLPIDTDQGAALLRAVEGIKDEAHRTAAKAAIKAGNEAMKAAFVRRGTTVGPTDDGSATADFQRAVAKAKAADPKLDDARARVAAMNTAEGRAAYKRMSDEARELAGATR